jgi:Cdc6-like AAA superfamily ATPase
MTEDQMTRLVVEIGRVFTPSQPIRRRALFAGRLDEIKRMVDAINSAGRHAILFGDKGVGKTSLATILEELFSEHPGVRFAKVSCEPNDTFASVWDRAMSDIGILVEHGDGNDQYTLNQWLNTAEYVGPGHIKKVLKQGNDYIPELVFIFDEFNELHRDSREPFARTLKEIADSLVGATVIMVGVAKNIDELLADHESVSRNLTQIIMPSMSRLEIKEIIHNGLNALNMTMASDAYDGIATLAQGYPHFAHLLSKGAALAAVDKRRTAITTADVFASVKEAIKDNSYNVPDEYHKATMAQRKGTLFEHVLIACALAEVDDMGYFSSADVKPVLSSITKKQYEIYGFSQHLDKFSSDVERGPVLEKRGSQRCYRYKFINPLLRPYSIIKAMSSGIVTIESIQRMTKPPSKQKTQRPPKVMPTPKAKDGGLFDGHS